LALQTSIMSRLSLPRARKLGLLNTYEMDYCCFYTSAVADTLQVTFAFANNNFCAQVNQLEVFNSQESGFIIFPLV